MLKQVNENGFTLVELLAVVVISSIIMLVTTGVIINSIQSYNTISNETELRNEADLLMSSIYKKIYTLKESQIDSKDDVFIVYSGTGDCPGTMKCKLGYYGKQFHLSNDTVYKISNPNISITNAAITREAETVYTISVTLRMEKKNLKKTFENTVRSINDKY